MSVTPSDLPAPDADDFAPDAPGDPLAARAAPAPAETGAGHGPDAPVPHADTADSTTRAAANTPVDEAATVEPASSIDANTPVDEAYISADTAGASDASSSDVIAAARRDAAEKGFSKPSASDRPRPPRPPFLRRARAATARRVRALASRRTLYVVLPIVIIMGTAWQRCGIRGCPNVSRLASYQPGGASVLLDRTGERFADLGPVDHTVIDIRTLPAYVPEAFVAVEDKRFYHHHGVDWRRVFGAALANLRAHHAVQGSSTITMQLSRNLFPERIRAADRTLRRKLLEVRVARDIEHHFTKPQILQLYLNHIYFGAGAYGIEAAARQYFGKSAKDLTVEQAAVLAALPKAPSAYDPRHYADRARDRRDLVLGLMAQQGYLTAAASAKAKSTAVRLGSPRAARQPEERAAWFAQAVRDLLEDQLGEDLYSRPLRITTTLDLRAQRAAEEELEAQIRRVEGGAYGVFQGPRMRDYTAGGATDYLQGAVVVMANNTGDVLAMVGGRDARQSSFNRATQARRQAGSAFKPFVYATALGRGWSPAQLLDDSPYRLVSDGKAWEPSNFDGEFEGPVSLRDALVFSRNVPTIRLASRVGEHNVARLAHAAGIRADLRETPMIALGIAEVSPLELTTAYTAFSGQGTAATPRLVLRVEDPDGKVLWQPPVEKHRVLDPGVAYMMTDLLRDAVDRGTGRSVRYAGYRGLAAGKTGTTNEGADTWFVGYTSQVTAGIWVGFDKPRPIAEHASGGAVAGYAWGRMMSRIASWAGGSPWRAPERVVQVAVDPETGLALEEGCEPRAGQPHREYFLRDRTPRQTCPERADPPRSGPSWAQRIVAWAGSLLDHHRDNGDGRLAARAKRRMDDPLLAQPRIAAAEPAETEEAPEPEPAEIHVPPESEWGAPVWPGAQSRSRPADAEWSNDVARALERALDQHRREEQHAIDWLQQRADELNDQLRDTKDERLHALLDQARRSLDEVRRASRHSQRQRLQLWLDQAAQELRRQQRAAQRREGTN